MKRAFVDNFCLGMIFLALGFIFRIFEKYSPKVFPEYMFAMEICIAVILLGFILYWNKKKMSFYIDEEIIKKRSYILLGHLAKILFWIFLIVGNFGYYMNELSFFNISYFILISAVCLLIRFFLYLYYNRTKKYHPYD